MTVFACSCILLAGCTSESDVLDQSEASLQSMSFEIDELNYLDQLRALGKNESILSENQTKVEGYDDGVEKEETSASDELKMQIAEILDRSFYKERTYLGINDGEGLVGVLENSSCGSYKKLIVFMDNEDRKGTSHKSNWTGTSNIDSNGNLVLNICAVPTKNVKFKRGVSEYAVLHLGGTVPDGIATITRFFDNEDDNNKNHTETKYDGKLFKGNIGQCTLGESNITLAFLYYESDPYTPDDFPAIGISYGAFGQFKNHQGSILTDDQDGSNANQCYITRSNVKTYQTGFIGKILDAGKNTELFMSVMR